MREDTFSDAVQKHELQNGQQWVGHKKGHVRAAERSGKWAGKSSLRPSPPRLQPLSHTHQQF